MTSQLPTPRTGPSPINEELRRRALQVIPGGMYGVKRIDGQLPPSFPQFYDRAKGVRMWDVDGNEYIDFMGSHGPMVLGYADDRVDAVAHARQRLGDPLLGPTREFVELAELLTQTVPFAEWAMFAKNGTDTTSMAVMIARAATGKKKILKATEAYHGVSAWFNPRPGGITAEDRANIIEFEYNDVESMEQAFASADGDVAGIILSPFRHDILVDQEIPGVEFAKRARELATTNGALLILDEVRTGMRLDLQGSWEAIGVRPDLAAMGKGLANGYPIAALLGAEGLRTAAQTVYLTGTFWLGAAPMAAAIETFTRMRDEGGIAHMVAAGTRFREGLATQALSYGFDLHQTGPVQMPMMLFADDPEVKLGFAFTDAAVRRGLLLHPWHNMFISAAHTDQDVDLALEITDDSFAELKRYTG